MATGSAARVVVLVIASCLVLTGCARSAPAGIEPTPASELETLVGVLPSGDRTVSVGCSAEGTWGNPGLPTRAEAVQELIDWYQRDNARLRPDSVSDPALSLDEDRIRQLALFRGLEAVKTELSAAEGAVGAGDSLTASGSIDGVTVGEVVIDTTETGGYQVTHFTTVGFASDHPSCTSEGVLSESCGSAAILEHDGSPSPETRTEALTEFMSYVDASWLPASTTSDPDYESVGLTVLSRGFAAALQELPESEAAVAAGSASDDYLDVRGYVDHLPVASVIIESIPAGGYAVTQYSIRGFISDGPSCALPRPENP